MSRYEYPEDEFDAKPDDGPVPVGVHRAEVPAWRSWIPLLIVLIVVPALAWGAVRLLGRNAGLSAPGGTSSSAPSVTEAAQPSPQAPSTPSQKAATPSSAAPSATPTQEETPAANVDYDTGVTVHNGTATTGLAGRTGDRLASAGFTGVSVSQGMYSADEPAASTVFYASAEYEATAQAVASQLGITAVVESADEATSNPIVVVLREDYAE